jgi:hypothetical protein
LLAAAGRLAAELGQIARVLVDRVRDDLATLSTVHEAQLADGVEQALVWRERQERRVNFRDAVQVGQPARPRVALEDLNTVRLTAARVGADVDEVRSHHRPLWWTEKSRQESGVRSR